MSNLILTIEPLLQINNIDAKKRTSGACEGGGGGSNTPPPYGSGLCVDMNVNKTKCKRNSSHQCYNMTCIGKTNIQA